MSSAPGSCAGTASVVFDPTLTEYDFGPQHPMSPVRVDLTMRLAEELGVLKGLRTVPAPMADDDLIATVHDPALIEAVTRMGERPGPGEEGRGLGTDDNPVFAGMHHAAAHVVGASVEAFRQVWSGESEHSVNIAGGLHHAMRDRASGFCIYNDVAIGIQWLLDQGAERVAYVDVDVHHGDGVEQIFWDDPRVLTISLHETGQLLFPGTGFAGRHRRAGRGGYGGQRRPAARHRRRRLAAGVPRRGAAAGARVRARRPGHPARLRLPRRRPARRT